MFIGFNIITCEYTEESNTLNECLDYTLINVAFCRLRHVAAVQMESKKRSL